ncbi:MAG: exonuclease [Mesorhizobium sp.]|nr:MAG: exonuclease [Mesorhizobium sp.]TIP43996.1 MAG: exonuclease [Mesorhizobium sp.]
MRRTDVYFSADVETDGPIPGPFSMLSFAFVYAGKYDGKRFERPTSYDKVFYKELSPISTEFQVEALKVSGLDRDRLVLEGANPIAAMSDAFRWIKLISGDAYPVLVAYPLSFDWNWLYWYFMKFAQNGSPFDYSRCFDIKTAFAVKSAIPIAEAGRSHLPTNLASTKKHTHHAIDDAIEQAEIFANVFEWEGINGGDR